MIRYDRRRWDRRLSRNSNDMADMNRRPIDDKLSDIDNMIRRENDEEKRNVLLVLHCLTSTLSSVSRVLEELEKQHSERFTEHENRIDSHEELVVKSKTAWNTAMFFGGVIQAMLMAAAVYGAGLFVEIQNSVHKHDRQIAILEQHHLESPTK